MANLVPRLRRALRWESCLRICEYWTAFARSIELRAGLRRKEVCYAILFGRLKSGPDTYYVLGNIHAGKAV